MKSPQGEREYVGKVKNEKVVVVLRQAPEELEETTTLRKVEIPPLRSE